MQHAQEKILKNKTNDTILSILQTKIKPTEEETKIPLVTFNGLLFVTKTDIIYCESNGNYTIFYTLDGKKITVSRQLGEYEKLLTDTCFIRIHDKYIINLQCMTEYIKGRGGDVKLNNGITLPVSANRKQDLLARFEKWLKH